MKISNSFGYPGRLARFALVCQILAALALASASPLVRSQNTSPQAPGNASPAQPPPTVDPAAAVFPKTASAGLLLVTVAADKIADYEEVIRTLQAALARATDPRQRALGQGWRVYKSDTGPKANAVYVHLIDPVVPQTDYRPSLLLDEILAGASAEMLAKYRDAIVGAPAMLSMNEFAHMAAAPPPPPANGSPSAPGQPKPPAAPRPPGG